MNDELKNFSGSYRFLITNQNLIIGTSASVEHPNHEEIAYDMGVDPLSVKGGYAQIWDKGNKMAFTIGFTSVPEATEEDFETAKNSEIVIYSASI